MKMPKYKDPDQLDLFTEKYPSFMRLSKREKCFIRVLPMQGFHGEVYRHYYHQIFGDEGCLKYIPKAT
jgi:hypothetical protein